MPIVFGGDMDDPNNPASPFVRREDAEAMAAEQLGLTLGDYRRKLEEQRELAKRRAAALLQLYTRTASTRSEALQLMLEATVSRIGVVRDLLQDALYAGDGLEQVVQTCVSQLDEFAPEV